MNSDISVVFQNEDGFTDVPSEADVVKWVGAVATHLDIPFAEVIVRIVDTDESHFLNETYRGKANPTNVLSFPFELPSGIPASEFEGQLGDLVICAPVVSQEAREQQKKPMDHWAHMVVHGTLHLAGFDHIDDNEADAMELIEIAILCTLNIQNPYDSPQ